MRKIPMYTRKKRASTRSIMTRVKALMDKEHNELYGTPEEEICPATSWREALRTGAIV